MVITSTEHMIVFDDYPWIVELDKFSKKNNIYHWHEKDQTEYRSTNQDHCIKCKEKVPNIIMLHCNLQKLKL